MENLLKTFLKPVFVLILLVSLFTEIALMEILIEKAKVLNNFDILLILLGIAFLTLAPGIAYFKLLEAKEEY